MSEMYEKHKNDKDRQKKLTTAEIDFLKEYAKVCSSYPLSLDIKLIFF